MRYQATWIQRTLIVLGLLSFHANWIGGAEPASKLPDQANKPSEHDRLYRRLEGVHRDVAFSARDSERDVVKAAHHFLHAGLISQRLGDAPALRENGVAAQSVLSSVEMSFPHDAAIHGVQLSPDGGTLACWTREHRDVRVWSLRSGKLLQTLPHQHVVSRVIFHSSTPQLLTLSGHGVTAWEIGMPEPLGAFDPYKHQGKTITGSPSGALWRDEGDVVVWNRFGMFVWNPKGTKLRELQHEAEVTRPSISGARMEPKTKQLLVWDFKGNAWLWNSKLTEVEQWFRHDGRVTQAEFTSPGILTWAEEGDRREPRASVGYLWDRDGKGPIAGMENGRGSRRFSVHPHGMHALSWGIRPLMNPEMMRATLWSLVDGKSIATFPHVGMLAGATFSPDTKHVATWSEDGTAKLWTIPDGKLVKTWTHDTELRDVRFSPNSEQLLLVSASQASAWRVPKLQSWSPPSRLQAPEFVARHAKDITGARFLANDRLLTWSDDGIARVWNMTGQRPTRVLRFANSIGNPPSPRWVGDQHLLVGGYNGQRSPKLWSIATGKMVWTAPENVNLNRTDWFPVDCNNSGTHIFLRKAQDKRIELWSIARNAALQSWDLIDTAYAYGNARFLADGNRYLVWIDRRLELHSIGKDEPIRTWTVDRRIVDVREYERGQLVVTSQSNQYGDGEILVFEADKAEAVRRFKHELDFTTAMAVPGRDESFIRHTKHRPTGVGMSIGKFRSLNQDKPRLQIDTFEAKKFEFDARGEYLVGFNSDRRLGWLWSAKTGKLLTTFHRRPAGASGFNENDLINFQIDPAGRFVLTWGGTPHRSGGRLRVWAIEDLSKPLAVYDFPSTVSVVNIRDDGTLLVRSGHAGYVLSATRQSPPLCVLKPAPMTAYKHVLAHPTMSDIFTVDMSSVLFRWPMKRWDLAQLQHQLNRLEHQTATRLDHGVLRSMTFAEWSATRH